jgi:hypothetical protein
MPHDAFLIVCHHQLSLVFTAHHHHLDVSHAPVLVDSPDAIAIVIFDRDDLLSISRQVSLPHEVLLLVSRVSCPFDP